MSDVEMFADRLVELAHIFDADAKQIIATGVQGTAQTTVETAVRGDLGDLSMSGWRRGAAIAISSHTEIEGEAIVVRPGTVDNAWRRGKGPMRVLEQGRNQGGAGGFHGPGVAQRDGKNFLAGETARTASGKVRKVRARARKRWNGVTTGRGTWSSALVGLRREVPPAAQEALFKDSVRKLFKG
jgi:hypothetical protein